jgi:two-component system, LytTR family, response regulator
MINCIAIDDEPLALEILKGYISKFNQLHLVQVFDDGIAGQSFLQANKVDLLFIDINMPDITGLELVQSLDPRPMIIFTTAHQKFAIDGFELDAVDYLLKPIAFERFEKAVQKAIDYFTYKIKPVTIPDSLFVYSEYRMVKIPLLNIEYIESLEDYIKIHVRNEKPILTLLTMKKVMEKLPAAQFRRIHRSYIVATDKVKSILNRKVTLISGVALPVSDSYIDFISDWKKV